MSRKSYEQHAVSEFDNPLSHRFDENDAVLFFDDVKVPWERVFVNQDIGMTLQQFHGTPAHVFQNYQCQIRLVVKMRFLAGIAHRIAEANGIVGFPQVRETLGQIAAEVGLVDGLLHGMEAKGRQVGAYFVPDRHLLYSAQTLTQALYPKVITAIRELAGGGVIMVPSSIADFDDPALAAIIDKTQKSPVFSPQERVKFFKLAWDALGSEFASRHVQYEMFYAGASLRHPRPCLPHLRLGDVQGHGRRADGELSDAGGAEGPVARVERERNPGRRRASAQPRDFACAQSRLRVTDNGASSHRSRAPRSRRSLTRYCGPTGTLPAPPGMSST